MRIAIETGAALVPVVCLGEISALKNLFNWPALQQWTYKNIGYPVPFLLVGRWGVTPFPRQTGLRFVIGEPIVPPPHTPGTQVKFVLDFCCDCELEMFSQRETDKIVQISHRNVSNFFLVHESRQSQETCCILFLQTHFVRKWKYYIGSL